MKAEPVIFVTTFILHLHHFLSGAYLSEIFIGCYEEFREFQSASLRNRSFLQCVSTCKIYKLPFIAIKSGQTCQCGDITDSRVFSQRCDTLCSDVPHSCGGFNLYAVYAILPFYHGCFITKITNSTIQDLPLSCQAFCPKVKFSYLTEEGNVCKCWGLFHRVGSTLMDDCVETCKPTEDCRNSFKTEVYSGDFIPGLNKFNTDIFMCFNGKPNRNATCDFGLCIDGWMGEKCDQRNCSLNNGECDKSECKEFQLGNIGYSECVCAKGFTNGLTLFDNCRDEDECVSNPCNTLTSNCVNEIGSYSCSCFDGYTLDVKSGGCKDKDECLKGECPYEGAICANTNGSFMCLCRPGFQVEEDPYCDDIPDGFSGCNLNFFQCNDGLCRNFPRPGLCKSIDEALSQVQIRPDFIEDHILGFVALIVACMCVVIILAHLQDKKIKHEIYEESRINEQTAAEGGLNEIQKKKSSISDEENT